MAIGTDTGVRRAGVLPAALAGHRLTATAIMVLAMGGVAPLTVVAVGAVTGWQVTGVTGIPAAYVVSAGALGLFAVGYVAMSQQITNAGAFYSYITRGLGRVTGVGAALVACVAYNAMQTGLYGGFGPAVASLTSTHLGWRVPWWAYALAGWAVVAVMGAARIDLSGWVLAGLLGAECAAIVVCDAVELAHPAGGHLSLVALAPTSLAGAGAGAAIVTAITGFVGFEDPANYGEEAKNPRLSVGRAVTAALVASLVLYAVSAWAITVRTGPANVVPAARAHHAELMFDLARPYLGAVMIDLAHALLATSMFAALLSFHNTCSRYFFALGRERVLPRGLGRASRRSGAPIAGSLVQSTLGAVVVVLFAVMRWDPQVTLLFWGTTLGGLGVLVLMAAASIAVVAFFAPVIRRRHASLWQRLIAPAAAAGLLIWALMLVLDHVDILLGVPPSSPWTRILPSAYAVAAVTGIVWALVLRARKPDVYQGIGLGADRVLLAEPPTSPRPPQAVADSPFDPPYRPAAGGPSLLNHRRSRTAGGPPIRPATPGDLDTATKVLTAAFLDAGPVASYLVADRHQRARVYERYFTLILEQALAIGEIDLTDDHKAAAVWLPHTSAQATDPPDFPQRTAAACGPHTPRFEQVEQALRAEHPNHPHTCLAYLGVLPIHQRRGHGTALLTHRHHLLDRAGQPAYLVASTADSRRLYRRLGYHDRSDPIVISPLVRLWPMWRPPQPARTTP